VVEAGAEAKIAQGGTGEAAAAQGGTGVGGGDGCREVESGGGGGRQRRRPKRGQWWRYGDGGTPAMAMAKERAMTTLW
jgi:hypothetical protein